MHHPDDNDHQEQPTMYANLAVQVTTPEGKRHTLSAWDVTISDTGAILVYTDKNDGESDHVEPGPVEVFPAGTRVMIEADF